MGRYPDRWLKGCNNFGLFMGENGEPRPGNGSKIKFQGSLKKNHIFNQSFAKNAWKLNVFYILPTFILV
jgi:hypothetical protein